MDGHNERQIVEWGYWTATFLFQMSEQIHEGAEAEISVISNFLRRNGWGENANFVLDNQAAILMTAYILLVYPRELLQEFDYNTLPDDLQQGFILEVPAPPDALDNREFIKRMRHAVAHARVELALGENGSFRFWNRPQGQHMNFDVRISKQNFIGFLARLGGIFVHYLRNHPAEV